MSGREHAVSEVVSFLLVVAVITAGIGIYAAVVYPEMQKSADNLLMESAAEEFCSLKADIDQFWLSESTGSRGKLLSSASAGALSFGKGTAVCFNHTGGQKTVSLLEIVYTQSSFSAAGTAITYEGGALFLADGAFLPAITGEKNAVLICTEEADAALLTNTPIALTYTVQKRETFRTIRDLQVFPSSRSEYWQDTLQGVTTITCVFCSLSAEAAA